MQNYNKVMELCDFRKIVDWEETKWAMYKIQYNFFPGILWVHRIQRPTTVVLYCILYPGKHLLIWVAGESKPQRMESLPQKVTTLANSNFTPGSGLPACFAYWALVTRYFKVIIWSFEVLVHVVTCIVTETPDLFTVPLYAERNRE